jgi:hypothetical protein
MMCDAVKRLLLIVIAAAALGIAAASATTGQVGRIGTTRHCGSFKYGTDGQQPGSSGITARNVSCWFARAVALLGPAPGWHCTLTTGILFVCKRGNAVVTFYGE